MLNYDLLHDNDKKLTSHLVEEQQRNRNNFLLAHLGP
jgi:hypothetical protein